MIRILLILFILTSSYIANCQYELRVVGVYDKATMGNNGVLSLHIYAADSLNTPFQGTAPFTVSLYNPDGSLYTEVDSIPATIHPENLDLVINPEFNCIISNLPDSDFRMIIVDSTVPDQLDLITPVTRAP